MKIKSVITHPYTLVVSFLLVFFNTHPFGEFYYLYLLVGVLYGNVFAIVGSLGIFVILFSHFRFKGCHKNPDASFINLIGAILLIISLFLFFYLTRDSNISLIFDHLLPFLSLLLFCILVTCFALIIP